MNSKLFGLTSSAWGWVLSVYPSRLFEKSFFCLQYKLKARLGFARDFRVSQA